MTDPIDPALAEAFWTAERLLAIAAFAFAGTWTPGPNNMMLASSGATYGFRRTVPHALGVGIGFAAMVFCVARGLGEVFQASSLLRESLRWAGVAVLLYLAWRIATSGGPAPPDDAEARGEKPLNQGRPLTFLEAAAFQWVNPKAWMMVIGVAAAYLLGASPTAEAAAIAVIFLVGGLTSSHAWAAFGAAMRRWLSRGRRLQRFNLIMGVALALFAIPMLID